MSHDNSLLKRIAHRLFHRLRTTPFVKQSLDRKYAGILDEPGELFKLLDLVLSNLQKRGVTITHCSRRDAPDPQDVLLVDQMCAYVLVQWRDAKAEKALEGGDPDA